MVDAVDALLDRADRFLAAGITPPTFSEIAKNTFLLDKDRIIYENTLDLPKPQLAFLHEIDNFRLTPFRPKLSIKYPSNQPYREISWPVDYLDSSSDYYISLNDGGNRMLGEDDIENGEGEGIDGNGGLVAPDRYYLHPYEKDLEQLQFPSYIFQDPSSEELVYPDPARPFLYVDQETTFNQMLDELQGSQELAIDLEHHSLRSFLGLTCLMQISSRQADYVIDVFAVRSSMSLLGKLFSDQTIVKVFHGSSHDLMWLQRDFSLYVLSLFDTYDAAKVLEMESLSYSHLVHFFCQKKLSKTHQLSDWRRRPLPQEMIEYARWDTHYLLYVYDCLRKKLFQKFGVSGVEEVMLAGRKRCLVRYEKPFFRALGYRHLVKKHPHLFQQANKNKDGMDVEGNDGGLSSLQEAVLAKLWDWRDATARKEDESSAYVMSNSEMVRIAIHLPRTVDDLQHKASPLSAYVRDHIEEVVLVINQALSIESTVIVGGASAVRGSTSSKLTSAKQSTTKLSFQPPSITKANTVFTFAQRAPTINDQNERNMALTMGSPVLETEALFRTAGWVTPDMNRYDHQRSFTPLIFEAIKSQSGPFSDEKHQRLVKSLEDVSKLFDPKLSNLLRDSVDSNSAFSGVPNKTLPTTIADSLLGDKAEEEGMASRSKEDDGNDLPEIPQSFDEIYKLSSKTKRKNKAKKTQSGANTGAEDGTAGSSSNPTEESFDFKQYFAQDKDTSALDTSADGTLAFVQEIGWVNDEEASDLRDEYKQVMEDNSNSGNTLANGGSNQDSLRASAPSTSVQSGQSNQTLWRSLEKGGSGRLSNSFDRASAKPTKSNSNNSNNSTSSYPNNMSMVAPSSSVYEKVSNKQHIVGALPGATASSTTKLGGAQGKNRPGSMKGSKAKAKPIDSQQHPYFGAFAKK
eukprot:scaffold233_cov174-Ochromonas_danica.AAC.50